MALKYRQTADRITEIIKQNQKKGIDKLPTEAQLCARYHVSRQTVRRALDQLARDGVIVKKHGSGSYITGLSPDPIENTVALLVNTDTEYIYPELISRFQSLLYQHGLSLQVFVTDSDPARERQILSDLLLSPVSMLLAEGSLSSLPTPNTDLYLAWKQSGRAAVFFHSRYPNLELFPIVTTDDRAGAYRLTGRLHDRGHQRIGGIFCRDDAQDIERYLGFLEAMRDLDLPLRDSSVSWIDARSVRALRHTYDGPLLVRLYDHLVGNCTAIVTGNDELAYWLSAHLGTLFSTHDPGLTLGSFHRTYLEASQKLPVIYATLPPDEPARSAVSLLLQQKKGLPVRSQEIPWQFL